MRKVTIAVGALALTMELFAGRRLDANSEEIRLLDAATDEMEASLARDDLDSWAEADARLCLNETSPDRGLGRG